MKTITKDELISMDACEEGLDRFIEQTNNTDEPVLIESLFNGKNTVADFVWLAGEICDIEKIRKFARDIALVNIDLIRPYCNESDYDLILNFLKTGENANALAATACAIHILIKLKLDNDNADDAAGATNAIVCAAAAGAAILADLAAVRATSAVYYTGELDFTPYLQGLFS